MSGSRGLIRWGQTFIPPGLQGSWWDARQWISRTLHRTHEHDFDALGHLGLPPDTHVLDLGANRGRSIDSVRAVLGDQVQITAVEPSRPLCDRLAARYPHVKVVHAAVGLEPGAMTLYTPSYRNFRYDALASTDPDYAVEWFRYSMWRYDPQLVTLEEQTVDVVRVDDLGVVADFVKIDVQGMEHAALCGMTALLDRCRPIVLIEAPEPATFELLAAHRYRPSWYSSRGEFVPDAPPGWAVNVFFFPL